MRKIQKVYISVKEMETLPPAHKPSDAATGAPIGLTLSGIKLSFEAGKWRAVSDLDIAAMEINRVMDERDHAISNLHIAEVQITALHKEIIQVNKTKKAALDMLLEERRQKDSLQQELDGYKAELAEAYKTIVELRYPLIMQLV
jgi:hypothetical protein